MSRIANKPIELPSGVNLTVNGQTISAKGPKGELTLTVHDDVAFEQNDNVLTFKPVNEDKVSVAMTGTMRSLANNIVTGLPLRAINRLYFETLCSEIRDTCY